MHPSEYDDLIRRYVAAYNAFDIDGMVALLHEDVVFQNISNGVVTHETEGVAAFREQAMQGAKMFASREQTITATASFEENGCHGITASIDYRGVLANDLTDRMKAGDTIELSGESEFRFQDGRIVSIVDRS